MSDENGVTKYRCNHVVEALRWSDNPENRAKFTAWFEQHGALFETRGPIVVLPEEGEVGEGDWVVFSDGEYLIMSDQDFTEGYEEATDASH